MECRFQHPGYVPGGLSFETTWSRVEKVSTGKSQTTNNLYQKLKWKTSPVDVRFLDDRDAFPWNGQVIEPPKKKDWTSLSSSLELCQFHLREDSRKLPASRVIDPSRPGQDLACKSRTECQKWVISDALPKARGVCCHPGSVAWVFQDLYFQSCVFNKLPPKQDLGF